jgi:hypothetical protein
MQKTKQFITMLISLYFPFRGLDIACSCSGSRSSSSSSEISPTWMLLGLMFSSAPFSDSEMVVILGSKECIRLESEAVVGDCDSRQDDLEVE